MEEIKGYVSDIIFRNEDNLYTVFEITTVDGTLTCTGSPASVSVGESCVLTGEYREHPVYGLQFHMASYRSAPPEGAAAAQRYLASGAVKGIGAALAARIVKKFGDDTLKIMEEQPERLSEVKGISENGAREIAAVMGERRDLRDAMLFLQRYDIGNALAVRIWKTYGMAMYGILRENPYRLAEDVDGVGFVRADGIARRIGIRADSEYRIRCGLLYVLSAAMGEGSSCLLSEELTARASDLLDVSTEETEVQLENLSMDRRIVRRQTADGTLVFSAQAYSTEQAIAHLLLDLNAAEPEGCAAPGTGDECIRSLEAAEGITLDGIQREAVLAAAEHSVLLITGGPGTGKTTTINTIIRYFRAQEMDVLLAAPTGRAAKRMADATGFEASTIHRMLGVRAMNRETAAGERAQGDGTGGGAGFTVFEKGKDDPLEADVIIIDEMSMVDMNLFRSLLEAVVPGTRLIMVGDADQLPSVGPGRVLQDLLESGAFPCIRLKKIFRQAAESDIVMNAHRINEGQPVRMDNRSRDFFFLERSDPAVICKHTVQLLRDKLPGYVHCASGEIQVITPMRKGRLGVEQLNAALQETLNPPSADKAEYRRGDAVFRVGDKVMQIRNNYQLEWEVRGNFGIAVDRGQGVFNGDFGVVKCIDNTARIFTVCFDEGREADYPFEDTDQLELAYAVTVHKSQGSEYPAVIMPLLSGPAALMTRNLLYTAVTRARKCVVILGSCEQVERMIANAGQNGRRTGLQESIRAYQSAMREETP
ncbi:MAG: AAA family ATPase [Lachnospiraceae bacterium]|jgi:exodeoxyribonuclease V alpha subunit|nr:AAA family ATPase [Lachnospiraceae bacterium]